MGEKEEKGEEGEEGGEGGDFVGHWIIIYDGLDIDIWYFIDLDVFSV